ncbi:MAG TPA: oligosaccharide flippase family protein [Usitatibacter sp.]|jgi:O-antigen/teichoic acid export membrane protein|nr:oligosaccharide flippase family protein [Usitatibacter sp.]
MPSPAAPRRGAPFLWRLVVHSSHYTAGSLLVTLASLISFPILTHAFSVAEYGTLNLIGSLLLLWTGLGKLGVQQSIARFHAETLAARRPLSESKFVGTVLIGMGATGLAATAGWILMAWFVPVAWWHDTRVATLLMPLSGLVLVRVADSAISNVLRAQQRSVLLNAYLVVRKYLTLGLVLLLIFTVAPGLDGFYAATYIVEATSVVALSIYLLRRHPSTDGRFSAGTFRDMVVFGAPMIAFEIAGIVLNLGDRYVLQSLLGPEAVGLYSAAYNFSDYVRVVLFTSIAQALTPIYARLYEEHGREPTARFVERSLRMYLMLSAAVLAGMTAVGGDILTLLASDRYSTSRAVIPLVVAALCIDGGAPFFSAGMYLQKRNHLIVPFVVIAAIGNIALNLVLVPRMGILGSAAATLASYVFLTAAAWRIGGRFLPLRFPFADLLKFAVLAVAMYGIVMQVSLGSRWLDVGAKIVVGVVAYGLLVLAFDRPARELAMRAAAGAWSAWKSRGLAPGAQEPTA